MTAGTIALGKSNSLRAYLAIGLPALAYLTLGKLSLFLAIPPGFASPIYPSSGIALAAVFIFGESSALWGIAMGSFLLAYWTGWKFESSGWTSVFISSLSISFGAVAEAWIGAKLVRRFINDPLFLISPSDILKFLFLGGAVASLFGATWGVGTLISIGAISWLDIKFTWLNWWIGDTIGIFVFTPVIFALFAHPRELWAKRRLSMGLPLFALFVLYSVISLQAGFWELKSNALSFDRAANSVVTQLRRSFAGYLDSLYAMQSVMTIEPHLKRPMFDRIAERWLLLYPGIYDVSWSPRILKSERNAYERETSAEDFPGYEVSELGTDGKTKPAESREEYYPTRFVTPYRKNDNILGFDQASNPERRKTMERARDLGLVTALGPVRLIQKVSFRRALILYLPVYWGQPSTVESRRKSLKGFVKSVFSLEDVIDASLGSDFKDFFEVSLFDGYPPKGKVLYPRDGILHDSPSSLKELTSLTLADRQFWVEVRPTETYLQRQRGIGPWVMLISGLCMSGLFAAFLLTITGHSFNIENELLEKKLLSAKLKASTEELSRSNAELEQFAYAASHDLQEPLRTIATHLQLVEKRTKGQLEQRDQESMNFVVDAAVRMSDLIKDILTFSRLGKSDSQNQLAGLQDILNAALSNLNAAILETQAEIETDSMPRLQLNFTEGTLLFQNLVSNALKYRNPGKPVKIKISSRRETDRWVISVIDNGIGISQDYLEMIFSMFKRAHTRTEYPGTGIGLALCKKIVERRGGKIWAESILGVGSKFAFTLPFEPKTA